MGRIVRLRVGALLAIVVGALLLPALVLPDALLEGVVVLDAVVLVELPIVDGVVAVADLFIVEPLVALSTPVLLAAAGYCGVEPTGAGVFDWVVVDCAYGAEHHTAAIIALTARSFERLFMRISKHFGFKKEAGGTAFRLPRTRIVVPQAPDTQCISTRK